MCTSAPLCKRLGLVKPSKAKDRISDAETARRIADNNIAIEQGCEADAVNAAR